MTYLRAAMYDSHYLFCVRCTQQESVLDWQNLTNPDFLDFLF